MKRFHLIDRNNGCRLVPAVVIFAEDSTAAEEEASARGYNCDWDTGDFHLVDVDEALAGSGLRLKEDA